MGTNYANDYSDGVRGTDERPGRAGAARGGPVWPRRPRCKRAALLSFGVAGVAGLALAVVTSPWLIAVGAAPAWRRPGSTPGGPRPYGYAGFGELFVFVFFGLVAVVGTAYVSLGRVTGLAVLAAVPVGLLSVALLVVNNLRDLRSDAATGKQTLAVRLGDRRTRTMYAACIVVPFLGAVGLGLGLNRRFALLALLSVPGAVRPIRRVMGGASGPDLVGALAMTGALQLCFGLLLAIGIAL